MSKHESHGHTVNHEYPVERGSFGIELFSNMIYPFVH